MKSIYLFIIMAACATQSVSAQTDTNNFKINIDSFKLYKGAYDSQRASVTPADEKVKTVFSWLSDKGFSIRKSFEGTSKDEAKPAFFGFNKDYKGGFNFTSIDVGVKLADFEPFTHASSIFIVSPKVEYHKDNTPEKEKDNFVSGVNIELIPWPITNPASYQVRPVVTGAFDYKRDFVLESGTAGLKFYLSGKSNRDLLPGGNTRNKAHALNLRYYLYTGYEHYFGLDSLHNESNYWVNRLFVDLWPIGVFTKNYLQITIDGTWRVALNDELYNKGNLTYITIGANFYPTGNDGLGIGVDYSEGDDPNNSFADVKKISLGLKIKI